MNRAHDDIEDELLVLRCQDGDGEALAVLFTRWNRRLARLAWHLTGHREAARDAVQDAWLAIARGIGRLDDPARFRSWACRIVHNRCADWVRRRKVQRIAAGDLQNAAAAASDPAGRANPAEKAGRVRDALAEMPGPERALLALHYLEGAGIAELARVFGVPAGTVKSRLYHARNRLKEAIERNRT